MTVGIKVIARNKRAFFDFEILETFEAGLVLTGTEIKGLRNGKVSLAQAWVQLDGGGQAWLEGMAIAPYSHGNIHNHGERRRRKLLLHAKELATIGRAMKTKGLTVVVLRLYLKKSWAKVEIALARGKRKHDKREAMASRESRRQVRRNLGH